MMGGNLAEVRGTCSSANMNCRRSSFIDMCQSASKRIGSQENAARESRYDIYGGLEFCHDEGREPV